MTTILIIEDEDFIRNNIRDLLSLEGYEVVMASNGLDGMHYVERQPPDLILCDILMPELDGYEVFTRLRNQPETAAIPFVFLTAIADKESMEQGMEMGADGYIRKPFSIEELLTVVRSQLRGK
jgi:CheY-like chemotaxis protein